jgi:hypothetical protein
LLPAGGIVRTTAAEITRGANFDLEKARAIMNGSSKTHFAIRNRQRGCFAHLGKLVAAVW